MRFRSVGPCSTTGRYSNGSGAGVGSGVGVGAIVGAIVGSAVTTGTGVAFSVNVLTGASVGSRFSSVLIAGAVFEPDADCERITMIRISTVPSSANVRIVTNIARFLRRRRRDLELDMDLPPLFA